MTMYEVRFTSYNGTHFFLHTTDPGKIGPWLAEMFGIFPYRVSSPHNVRVTATENFRS